MSWETDAAFSKPCECGAGIIQVTQRSNDWFQFEEHQDVQCPTCKAIRAAVRQRRTELKERAKSLAEQRYLDDWLAQFEGMNKRQAWFQLTQGRGYPSLGNFYKHVKDEGIDRYLRRNFFQDVEKALTDMGKVDAEVSVALAELGSLPDYDSREQKLPH